MIFLKQSTSVDLPIGPFVDDADGFTPETSLTLTQPDIRLKKNAGNWAQKNASQTLSHEENGWYEVTLDATDTDTLGHLMVAVYESGALPVWREFLVVPANTYDSLVSGSDVLQADVTQFSGTNGTFASGRPEVNVSHFGGSAGTFASGRAEVNTSHFGGSAGTFSGGRPEVNVSHWRGTAAASPTTAGVPAVEVIDISSAGASDIRAALGLASANLDTQIGTLSTFDPDVTEVESGYTWTESARIWSAYGSMANGLATTTVHYRNPGNTKNRITATVDESGNRTAVTFDLS